MVVYGVIVNICNILGISWACSFYYISSSPPFWHQGTGFMEDSFSMDQGREGGGCFWDDSGTSHLLWISFLLLLYQLHCRASGIRSWRLGTPVLGSVHTLHLLWEVTLQGTDGKRVTLRHWSAPVGAPWPSCWPMSPQVTHPGQLQTLSSWQWERFHQVFI